MHSKNPNFLERVQEKFSVNNFSHHVGFSLSKIEPGFIESTLELLPHHQQQDGFVHGGVTLTICDVVAGFAAYSVIPAEERVVTAEIKVSFLRPAKGTHIRAVGKVLKAGRKMQFCESEVYAINDGVEKLVAKATSIMANV